MKKILLLVSCCAVLLIMSNVSVAQEAAVPACPCQMVAAPGVALPFNHPGLSVNSRELRRLTAVQGRIAARQMRLEARYAVPQIQYPFMPAAGEGVFAGSTEVPGFMSGVVQTGRRNNNTQRVASNNAPVINFMSLVRGPQPVYPPYYAPAAE